MVKLNVPAGAGSTSEESGGSEDAGPERSMPSLFTSTQIMH